MMWTQPPVDYIEPLFRPPSEARSLILQVTNGCSWNRCAFCEMYTQAQKKFKPKAEADVLAEIERCGQTLPHTRRVFLADGDAMALSYRRLKAILEAIRTHLPAVTRVTAYCLPRNVKNKTVEELAELRALGLSMVYVGVETGDDTLLNMIDKGETYQTTAEGLKKLQAAGIKRSVMIINGLGGLHYSAQHVAATARLMNEIQPEYLASLVLFFSNGARRYETAFAGQFKPLNTVELLLELRELLSQLTLTKTIFRSDHASNILPLKGVLGQDQTFLLEQLDQVLAGQRQIFLRDDSYRSL